MKSFKKALAFVLSALILLSLASCDMSGIPLIGRWFGNEKEVPVDDTLNGFLIIRSETSGNDELNISKEICDAFHELGYADAAIKTDWVSKDNPPEKEILVGKTNRAENASSEGFSDNDYYIKGTNHKISIVAETSSALDAAAKYFISELLPKLSDGSLKCADVDYKYDHIYNVKSIYVGNAPLSDCVIILGNEINPTEKQAISGLCDLIYKLSGIKVPVFSESDELPSHSGEIVFGGSSADVSGLCDGLSEDEFALASKDNSLLCASKLRYGALYAVEYLTDTFLGGGKEDFTSDRAELTLTSVYRESVAYESLETANARALEFTRVAASRTEICNMLTEGLSNPVGMDNPTPEFSWYLKSPVRGEKQLSYRIGVASSPALLEKGEYDIWDSGAVNSQDTSARLVLPPVEKETVKNGNKGNKKDEVEDAMPKLQNLLYAVSRYYWQVTVETAKSGTVKSDAAFFETGLTEGGFSDAKWIGASSYYCPKTVGAVEAQFTLKQNAAGVSFGISEAEDFYYMWQFNVSNNGYAVLRPHIYRDGGWQYLAEVSLKDEFPTADAAMASPIDMRIEINDGIIKTSINGKLVSTEKQEPFPIGNVKKRLSGGELADYEYVRIVDENGAVLSTGEKSTSAPMYRHDFEVGEEIVGARLYTTALGAYEVWLNGQKLGDRYLAPGRTQYTERIYYQSYDVTSLIKNKNAIAAIVGNGWYNSKIVGGGYGDKNAFLAKLVMILSDGSQKVITTGDGWNYSLDGPVLYADLYDGEGYDARLKDDGISLFGKCTDWQEAKVYESSAPLFQGSYEAGVLTAETVEPVRRVASYTPIAVTNPSENVFVYDFGQNMAGTVSVTASAESGKVITLNYGEYLSSAEPRVVETAYMLGHNGVDRYIFAGNEGEENETFSPSLVYHGFRYLQIEGLSEALPLENVRAYAISSDLRRTGWFESSNSLLNEYYENTIHSQRSNFVSTITDCPTREKNGWTGDAQIFAKTGAFNMNVKGIYENFMEMLRDSMSQGGAVPEILPSRGTSDNTKTPSGWSDAVVTIPYELYYQYGDKTLLSDNYASMKAWMEYLLSSKFTPGKDDYVRDDGNYGDHLAYFNNKENVGYRETEYSGGNTPVWRETSYSEIGTAYSAYTALLISRVADILGYADDAATYSDLYAKLALAWRTSFLEADGVTSKAKSQTSYVMGLYFNLYEDAGKRAQALTKLCELIEENGGVQTVGFIGISYLFDVLSDNGRTDVVYKLLQNTQSPSLLYPVMQGATSNWESYNGGSHNHFVQGSPVRWLYTGVLGIDHNEKVGNEGYKSFDLNPQIGGGLTFASGGYESASGVIMSAWKLTEDGYIYECTVPANTSATLTLPMKVGDKVLTSVSESGSPLSNAPGVAVEAQSNEKVVIVLESGSYSFSLEA